MREGAPEWLFYEGPPTANGQPGIHHVEPRTFKDVYPRYKTMTGHLVRRKGGWDCHGLPGRARGREGDRHDRQARHRGVRRRGVQPALSRVRRSATSASSSGSPSGSASGSTCPTPTGRWSTEYIESVWWSLKRLHERGLLVEADKVTAYCPRCGTALSDAEVALGYRTVEDPSIYVRFPIARRARPLARRAPRCSSGRRRPGRCRRTRGSRSRPTSATWG